MSIPEQHAQRLEFLQLLRVLATVAVVFGHACAFYDGFGFTQWPNFPYVQNIAVTVFFCISGYTIAWVCHRRTEGAGTTALGWFAFGRFIRLGAPLIPLLLICAALEPLILSADHPHGESLSLRSLIGNMLFLQWLTPQVGDITIGLGVQPYGLNRPLWTLALEFWTYILFAGAFFGLAKGVRLVPILVSAAAAVILGAALYGAQGDGLPLIWLLSAGLYFALLKFPPVTSMTRAIAIGLLAPTAALLCLPALWPINGAFSLSYNLLLFVAFALLILVMSGDRRAGAPLPKVEFFAGFAYSTYIVHYPVLYLVHSSGWLPSGEVGAIVATVIGLGSGWLFSLPFERNYKSVRNGLNQWLITRWANFRTRGAAKRPS